MSASRRPIHFNPKAVSWTAPAGPDTSVIKTFHESLPLFETTKLVSLDDVAKEIGVGAVYIKDESLRLGLPAFKVLGASWAIFRVLAEHANLSLDSDIQTVKKALAEISDKEDIRVFTATAGNYGRAVARIGALLGVSVEIHVPQSMHHSTIVAIQSEGANVLKASGGYDVAVAAAHEASKKLKRGFFIQDVGFEGYEDIPNYVVDGYTTMLRESDEQLGDKLVDFVICPTGAASLAQAVVSHYKAPGRKTTVATVEADTAASVYKSLVKGEPVVVETNHTIMAGLECGEVSSIAWPYMRGGVDASMTVSDYEAHVACQELVSKRVFAGPCGASGLAALRRMSSADKEKLGLGKDSTVLLLCTEGQRSYDTPLDVSVNDPVALTQMLVQIDSSSPDLGSKPGPGETKIAHYIKSWLEHRDIEAHWLEPTKGRPSVIGVARGSGGGKSLMLNGHIDTVTLQGYEDDALSGVIKEGRLYGRGAADMKCGVAAAMIALSNAKQLGLKGDVIFTGVADEENMSIGTEQVLEAGWTADAAVVSEPTNVDIIHAHKGFVWFEVDIHGVASHGSRADLGVDAICKAGHFLVALEKYGEDLLKKAADPVLEAASVHASLIKGGEEVSSYPASCTITIERRTIAGETAASVTKELQSILDEISGRVANFKYDLRMTFDRSPFSIPKDDAFLKLVGKQVGQALGAEPRYRIETFWTDCALLADKGIKTVLWGPKGEGLHAKEEWVDTKSIETVAQALTAIAAEYCG